MSAISQFVGQSRALSSQGMESASQRLDAGPAELWTVLGVETSGCGFGADRRPQILYERHVFHSLTQGRFDDGDISDAQPGGYGPAGDHQYDRLMRAMQFDRTAALKSASWGLGQVLGRNYQQAAFPDVEVFVQAMCDSEDSQLVAVSAFIGATGLAEALRSHDWASFARGYNGSQYAKNKYDIKLDEKFQKYSAGRLPDLDVRALQLYLRYLGFDPGPIDGAMGDRTRAAIRQAEQKLGMSPTGNMSPELLARVTPS